MVNRYDKEIRFNGMSTGNAAVGSITGQYLGATDVFGGYSCTNFTIKRDVSDVLTFDALRQVVNTLIYDLTKPR